ncbi:hypothetical protein CUN38_05160 [Enterococcus faecium]|uniref:hypothetical protein n=1 Tax=Enterococcus faecium TaxID=1352 RepID=UPI000CF1B06A|nr:hypothetical protein [Enterococcus faecium]PQC93530.1 hypothetical protein CUN38_05160 [Enterococcus faecium]
MYEHLLIISTNDQYTYGIGVDDEQLEAFVEFTQHVYANPENAFIRINGNLIQHSKISDYVSFTKEEVMFEMTKKDGEK